jgi:Family of unknown function (DUF5681)
VTEPPPDTPEKAVPDQARRDGGRWRPGVSGNPKGRPPRSQSDASARAQATLDENADQIMAAAIAKALAGDGPTLRALVALLIPPQRARPMTFEFPPLREAKDAMQAFDTIAAALARGELTETETKTLVGCLEAFLEALNAVELEARLAELEARMPKEAKQ